MKNNNVYIVEVEEILRRSVSVCADTREDAIKEVNKMIIDETIVLDSSDFAESNIRIELDSSFAKN